MHFGSSAMASAKHSPEASTLQAPAAGFAAETPLRKKRNMHQ